MPQCEEGTSIPEKTRSFIIIFLPGDSDIYTGIIEAP